jgi:hypothetical protein
VPEVTVVENSNRGITFWLGALVGIVTMLIVFALLWFMGIIDLFPQESTGNTATSNNVSTPSTNLDDVGNIANETREEEAQEEEQEAQEKATRVENPYYVEAVMSRDVDAQANPVDETTEFTSEDDRFYVIVTLDASVPAGEEIGVEWLQGEESLSDFSTKTTKGQTRAYFYQPSSGEGDYSVRILINGDLVDQIDFSVQKS